MSKKFACYLVDVRNDGKANRPSIEWHREVVKEDRPLSELKDIGNKLLTLHPSCDRITILGSGNKRGVRWLYDSANKISQVDPLDI